MAKNALSILSHVTHGYVGNKAVVFPLQYYGWNVDALHTTELLNHPGYGQFKGQKVHAKTVEMIFDGLKRILDLNSEYQLILVGYCPSAQVMSTIYQQIIPLMGTKNKKKPVLVVDPVLGDNGMLYVPQEIVDAHVQFLRLGLVNLTTPNQFEVELLTGITINSWSSLKRALAVFNETYNVPNVVVLSVVVDGEMYGVGYYKTQETVVFSIKIAKIESRFSGCGDVFTALMTNAFYENDCRLTPELLGQVLAKVSRILLISYNAEMKKQGKKPTVVQDVRLIELRRVFEECVNDDFEVQYL